MAIEKIDREELKNLLNSIFAGSNAYQFIEGTNPCRIKYNEEEYYIYQKNLSPAQLSNNNPDIWRVQLPIRDIFDYIKESPLTFVLLGYDAQNDVYATWNPYWTKQRLNNAKSVSFYSRKALQDQAKESQSLQRQDLNHGGEVIVFPSIQLPYYLDNIKKFFPEETIYVALGSRKRTEANEAYRQLTDSNNINDFAHYLALIGLSNVTINNYCRAIKKLIDGGYFSRNRKVFLIYDSLSDYPKAIPFFFEIDEVQEINEVWHRSFSAALPKYISFLMELNNVNTDEPLEPKDNDVIYEPSLFDQQDDEESDPDDEIKETEETEVDWEKEFTDENGKLTRIANPELIDKLRPCLDDEYPSYPNAFSVIEDFYGDRFAKTMQFKDWQKLLESINWSKPYQQPEDNTPVANEGRRKTHILRVTYPDGHVAQNRMVADTLIDVISNSFPDLIAEMNIYLAGVNLVSKVLDPKYSKFQREIQDGWYVMTNSSTDKKQEIIQRISDELDLNLLVEQIPIEDVQVPATPKPYPTGSNNRSKIQVTLPTGGVIYSSKVLETLLEVIKLAGADKVRELGITVCGDNLVLHEEKINPRYETATKSIGNGWYVNTCSDTGTKYNQIKQISDQLGLELKVELV